MTEHITTTQEPISAVPPPVEAAPEPAEQAFQDPRFYFNRELSWLTFNDRVLQLAEDTSVPLMERLKFAAIHTSNLDEFFMIRVAGLHDQIDAGLTERGADGLRPAEVLDAVRARVIEFETRQDRCIRDELLPKLEKHGIEILRMGDLGDDERAALAERYRRQIFPVLTPLAVGLGRPFPYISNLSLSLGVLVR